MPYAGKVGIKKVQTIERVKNYFAVFHMHASVCVCVCVYICANVHVCLCEKAQLMLVFN